MKYFFNTSATPTEDVPKVFVLVSEDGREYMADPKKIDAEALADFLDSKKHGKVEVWAYQAMDWWATVRDLFGLPKTYHDLADWHQQLGAPTLPAPPVNASPKEQAVWNRDVWSFLSRYAGQVAPEAQEEEEPPESEQRTKKPTKKK